MKTVISKDGTRIAYDKTGQGTPLILVVGAFNDRTTGVLLAQALESHFTVYNYDRRGRGESGDTLPYSVEREIEDINALIQEAGGSALVFGYSSGAVLSLRAAARGLAITSVAVYDPPPTGREGSKIAERLNTLVEAGRRGDAVELFQTDVVGIPAEVVATLRNAPFRPALEQMAHTLVYEMTILHDETLPPAEVPSIKIPALIMVGGSNPELLLRSAQAFAEAVPGAQFCTLDGQTHDINPAVMAPVMEAFFTSGKTAG
jgi:pimeloyl-ACP methyl ester carboxylesterase